MRVLLLSRYSSTGASSRVRYLQYKGFFEANGVELAVSPLFSDAYLAALYSGRGRVGEVLRGYSARLWSLIGIRRYDVVIVEKEVLPFVPAIVEASLFCLGIRYVVDYDDALFHRYDTHGSALIRRVLGKKIDSVMRNASLVIVGNNYLAKRAELAGAVRIEIVPSVIDGERYQPVKSNANVVPVIGWIGTPKTSHYLVPLLPITERLRKQWGVRFIAVGARPQEFRGTSIEVEPWSEESEVSAIQKFDIGIMPLSDSPWERGKCGYKIIQYWGCGVPIVASPVGVNADIVNQGKNGLLATDLVEWEQALEWLLRHPKERKRMGAAGRAEVESWYCTQLQGPRLLELLKEVAANGAV